MPDIFAETLRDFRNVEHAIAEHLPRHGEHPYADDASQAPADTPVTITTATEGEPMPLLDTLKQHVEADVAELEGKLASVDEEAIAMVTAVKAHPQLWEGFRTLAAMGGIPIPDGALTTAIDVLSMTAAKLGAPAAA